MKRHPLFLPSVLSLAAATGACVAFEGGAGPTSTPLTPLSGPSHSSTLVLAEDDGRLVVANVEAGTASVFAVRLDQTPPALDKVAEVAVGAEPSQVIMLPSGDSALVLARKDQRLVRIDGLRGTPTRGAEAAVGSEPTGMALSPLGTKAYVANWVDGTVSIVDTATMKVTGTLDLNAALVGSGLLGNLAPRPALAHPRSVAITNDGDGDENDETLWVTEFYAQQKMPVLPDGSNADLAKVGVLYRVPLGSGAAQVVELPPLEDMGFRDHNGGVAGCFPNQLLSLGLEGDRVFVTSICASPRGPQGPFTGPPAPVCTADAECPGGAAGSCDAGRCKTNCSTDEQCGKNGGKCNANVCAPNVANVKTTVTSALTVVKGNGEVEGTVNLAKVYMDAYDARGLPDDASRRLPLNPFDVAFVPGANVAYLAANGADAVFRLDTTPSGASPVTVAADERPLFVDLSSTLLDPSRIGRLPTGVVVSHKEHGASPRRYGVVHNQATRNVTVVDLTEQAIAGLDTGTPAIAPSSPAPESTVERERMEGRYFFNSGLGRWSLKGQAWLACQSCHVDGLSDNVTWHFPRGPRQPQSLDGTYSKKDPSDIRANNWTAIQDEIADHEMGAIRGTAGGVGAIVSNAAVKPESRIAIDRLGHAGLSGSAAAAADPKNPAGLAAACVSDDWHFTRQYVRSIRSPRRPTQLAAEQVSRGRQVFQEGNCQGCHGGDKWTLSRVFYTPDPANLVNNALKARSWSAAVSQSGFPASLLPAATPEAQTMRYNGKAAGDLDSLTCLLRPVGTFGVAEPEVGVAELRRDMKTAAQGNEESGRGYQPPSLLGLSLGAPYLHAGQVRTLEALFSDRFQGHHQALAPGFLAGGDAAAQGRLADLVAFLLAIDEEQETLAVPPLGAAGGDFCSAP